MPGFLEPIWETVFRVATWSALIFGALSIGSAFISAWVGWEITDATQKDADKRIKAADERIAESNARTREAELKLEQLRKLAGPRGINHSIFEAELKGKPKAPVVIWYLPDSSDGWNFSFQLQVALLSAGWEVGRPIPIPAPETMPWRDMPRAMVAGGQPSGVTVVGTDLEMNDPAFKALFEALSKSTDFGTYGSGGSQAMPVPAGTLRVVVAGKMDPIFLRDPPPNQPSK